MVFRVVFAAGLVLVLMAAIANGAVLRRVGLTGSCSVVRSGPAGAQLEGCSAGWWSGYPSLSGKGCTNVGTEGRNEYWNCPTTYTP